MGSGLSTSRSASYLSEMNPTNVPDKPQTSLKSALHECTPTEISDSSCSTYEWAPTKWASLVRRETDAVIQIQCAYRCHLAVKASEEKRDKLRADSGGGHNWKGSVRAAFRLMDSNATGRITREQMMRGMRNFEAVRQLVKINGAVDEDYLAIYSTIDADKSGEIDEEEWIEYFCPRNDMTGLPMPIKYQPDNSPVRAFLIDLDGTIYHPGGLIPGAREFYKWLVDSNTPFMFLSNTGAKGQKGVQKKLMTPPFQISDEPVPLKNIYTAANAQIEYMSASIPPESKLLVISGSGYFWREMIEQLHPGLMETWDIRESLTMEEAKEWAMVAAKGKKEKLNQRLTKDERLKQRLLNPNSRQSFFSSKDDPLRRSLQKSHTAEELITVGHKADPRVCIVFFLDGEVNSEQNEGWSYELIQKCSFLLAHGAELIYTADDPFNPSFCDDWPGQMFPLPGPGMFVNMLRPVMGTATSRHGGANNVSEAEQFICCGKGGSIGDIFMMQRSLSILNTLGHDGDCSTVCMIGDRYATDVRGATHVGLRSCLVLSGCETLLDRERYPTDYASYWAESVNYMYPGCPSTSKKQSDEIMESARDQIKRTRTIC